MKRKQAPTTEFQSIDSTQLDTVIGGCACGCAQGSCNCADGSCNPAQKQQRSWGR